jgi:hypothetical protein
MVWGMRAQRSGAAARVELVVTDLDGTLWGSDERVHDRTLAALRTLEKRDVPVLVATGRRRRSAVATLGRAGLRLPAVVLDGALGCDAGADRVFHRASFDVAEAGRVLAAFERAGISPCVYVDRREAEVVVGEAPSTHPRHLANIGPWVAREDLSAAVAGEPVFLFAVAGGRRERFVPIAEGVAECDGSVAITRDVMFGGVTLTVRPPGVSKWNGVVAWCRDQGLDPGRVLAIGDGQNDVELLGSAAVACAIRDGCAEVLDLAHHVLDPPATGGWSAVVDLL